MNDWNFDPIPPSGISTYDAAHPDDVMILSGPATVEEAAQIDPVNDRGMLAIGMLSAMNVDSRGISFLRPAINGRSLKRALMAGTTQAQFGLLVLLRSKDRQVIRATYYENCNMQDTSMTVSAGSNLVNDQAYVSYSISRELSRDDLPWLATEFDPPPPSLIKSSAMDLVKRFTRKKSVFSPRERARHEKAGFRPGDRVIFRANLPGWKNVGDVTGTVVEVADHLLGRKMRHLAVQRDDGLSGNESGLWYVTLHNARKL
jgi:hypothetical protein